MDLDDKNFHIECHLVENNYINQIFYVSSRL